MNPRALAGRARKALEAAPELEARIAGGQPADIWMASWFRAHRAFGSQDRRFYSDVLFSLLRWRGWIGTVTEAGLTPLYLAHQLHVTEPDAMSEALAEMENRSADRQLPALGSASLEEKARALGAFLGRPTLSVQDLVPDWVPAALATPPGLTAEGFERACIESFQQRPALWLLALNESAESLANRLRASGLEAVADPRSAGAVRLQDRPHLERLEQTIGPCFEVQDLASQAVVAACRPEPGETWWDACCGGGGKAIGLAVRLSGAGRVLATDRRESATQEAVRRARRAGLRTLDVRVRDGRDDPPGSFQGVLVDAPCSGLGTWSRAPDARWRTAKDVPAECSAQQSRLLESAARAVRPGGALVYSVCTLTRTETTGVTEAFARTHPDFQPERFPHPLTGVTTAAEAWILPWQGPCGAMFIARWRRRGN